MSIRESIRHHRRAVDVALLCLSVLMFHLLCIHYAIFWCDNVDHLVGAWSLASGRGYADIARPDAPPILKYPPGYAVTLVPLVWALGDNFKWYRIGSIIPFVLALPFLYSILRRRLSHAGAWIVTAIFAFHPTVIWANYLLCQGAHHLLVFFAAFDQVERIVQDRTITGRRGITLVLLLAAGFYLHRIGLVFIGATLVFLLARRPLARATCRVGLATALLIAPWMVRSLWYSGHLVSPEYESEIAERIQDDRPGGPGAWPPALLRHVWLNALATPRIAAQGLLPFAGTRHLSALLARLGQTAALSPALSLVALVVLVGFLATIREGMTFWEFYSIIHMGMLWIFFVSFKYMTFIAPFLWYDLMVGTRWLWRRVTGRSIRHECVLALGIALVLTTVACDKFYWDSSRLPAQDAQVARWAWLSRQVPEDAPIVCAGVMPFPELIFLATGRCVIPAVDAAHARRLLARSGPSGVRFLLVRATEPLANPLSPRDETRLDLVAADACTGTRLYQRRTRSETEFSRPPLTPAGPRR